MTKLALYQRIMKEAGLSDPVIRSFSYYFTQVEEGNTGYLAERSIIPPEGTNIFRYDDLSPGGNDNLNKLVVIKLNGGLGTSMGLNNAKSLLQVKEGLNFLDIICRQMLRLRIEGGDRLPLIFMHSYNTRKDCLEHLSVYGSLRTAGLPLDFLQNKFPRISQKDLMPIKMADPAQDWSPPGHGEIYLALQLSGILDSLLELGIEYAFISNSDNLGAVVDRNILDFIISSEIPFLIEVCRRGEQDKKGGHLAQLPDGQLILREVAQCPLEDLDHFQNIDKYRYFNTNNLWVNLKRLKKILGDYDNLLPLPLILNAKTVGSEKVFQIETAMGSAIRIFPGSRALLVGRDRFIPVKKTDDLVLIRSDSYYLDKEFILRLHPDKKSVPSIQLDPDFYGSVVKLEPRFPGGIPSLLKCDRLHIKGDFSFGRNILFRGNVDLNSAEPVFLENVILGDRKD